MKRLILIDLDGVLNKYGKKPFDENYIPPPKPGAKSFLRRLNKNYDLVIFTSRSLLISAKWVIKYDLEKYIKDITNIKIPAYLYIDDRAINFNGNYNELYNEIENFKVHWK